MKKLLILPIVAMLLSCRQSELKMSDEIKKSNSTLIEENDNYRVYIQKIDTSEYIVIKNRINGGVAITKK